MCLQSVANQPFQTEMQANEIQFQIRSRSIRKEKSPQIEDRFSYNQEPSSNSSFQRKKSNSSTILTMIKLLHPSKKNQSYNHLSFLLSLMNSHMGVVLYLSVLQSICQHIAAINSKNLQEHDSHWCNWLWKNTCKKNMLGFFFFWLKFFFFFIFYFFVILPSGGRKEEVFLS